MLSIQKRMIILTYAAKPMSMNYPSSTSEMYKMRLMLLRKQ